MKRLFKILSLLIIVAVLVAQTNILDIFKPKYAFAVGDLTINWGVPTGDPIFVVTNMLPGDTETRSVDVTNNASSARPIAIKGVKTSEIASLSSVLDIEIKDGGTTLYDNTLSQFFTDSLNPDGIPLNTINSGASKTYTFIVTFQNGAGNEFQNAQVIFDIIIGIAVDVPSECEELLTGGTFPIFGTSGNDLILGTLGNDVIFALEGNDRVLASLGDDCIVGGPGNDELRGEVGEDLIFGNGGNDSLWGGNNDDEIFGGIGNDLIRGENGEDLLEGEDGNDTMFGGNSNDIMHGGNGNDTMNGENGDDTVNGDADNDTLIGGNGDDTLVGGANTDSANGMSGTDTCDAETEVSCEI